MSSTFNSIAGSLGNISIASLKNSLDEVRAQVYPRNETERKVYEALSSKNWGASTTLMGEIANDTMDYEKFGIVMTLLWQSIEADGKSWKQMFKAMTLIEFLIKNGSERVVESCRDKQYKIRQLQEFNYYEGGIDKGSGVREKAKQIVELLASNELIRTEREKARTLRNKLLGIGNDGRSAGVSGFGSNSYSGGGGYGGYGGGGSSGGGYGGSGTNSARGGYSDDRDTGRDYSDSFDRKNEDRYTGSGPKGYSDEPSEREEHRASRTKSRSQDPEDDEEEVKTKHKSKSASKNASSDGTGGKLKVTLKKGSAGAATDKHSQHTAAPAAKAPEVDLLDTNDFFASAPAPAPAPAPVAAPAQFASFDAFGANSHPTGNQGSQGFDFDAFATAPTAAPQQNFAAFPTSMPPAPPVPAQPAAQQNFGNFGAPVPAAQNFNAMMGAPAPQVPVMAPMQQPMNNMSAMGMGGMGGMQQQQQQYQQQQVNYGGFTSSPPPVPPFPTPGSPKQMQGYGMAQQQQQQHQQQQQQYHQPTMQQYGTPRVPSRDANDFGDFEGAPKPASAAPAANSKWGDIGKLVDLGGISKNEDKNKQAAKPTGAYGSADSFAGLDGFSKSQQSMSAGASAGAHIPGRPLGTIPNTGGGMGMAAMSNMGSPMGMQPGYGGYGAPMGAPMGGAPQYPAQGGGYGAPMAMGGMPGQMGGMGYPQPGAGMGYPQQGQGMGQPGMMGGYPPQMGGMGGMGAYGAPRGPSGF